MIGYYNFIIPRMLDAKCISCTCSIISRARRWQSMLHMHARARWQWRTRWRKKNENTLLGSARDRFKTLGSVGWQHILLSTERARQFKLSRRSLFIRRCKRTHTHSHTHTHVYATLMPQFTTLAACSWVFVLCTHKSCISTAAAAAVKLEEWARFSALHSSFFFVVLSSVVALVPSLSAGFGAAQCSETAWSIDSGATEREQCMQGFLSRWLMWMEK